MIGAPSIDQQGHDYRVLWSGETCILFVFGPIPLFVIVNGKVRDDDDDRYQESSVTRPRLCLSLEPLSAPYQ